LAQEENKVQRAMMSKVLGPGMNGTTGGSQGGTGNAGPTSGPAGAGASGKGKGNGRGGKKDGIIGEDYVSNSPYASSSLVLENTNALPSQVEQEPFLPGLLLPRTNILFTRS
jgi:hypothetical protein